MTIAPHVDPEPAVPTVPSVAWVTTPIIDCEPPPLGPVACPPPASLVRRRRSAPHLRPVPVDRPAPTPPAAAAFADAALRRVLEVIDRRRPAAQLRGLLAAGLIDATVALAGTPQPGGTAVLRRVGLRRAAECGPDRDDSAEVFATFSRGPRVRAIAARIELVGGRWQVVALQVG